MSAFAISALIIAAIVGTAAALGAVLIGIAMRPRDDAMSVEPPNGDVPFISPDASTQAGAQVALALALATAVSLIAIGVGGAAIWS